MSEKSEFKKKFFLKSQNFQIFRNRLFLCSKSDNILVESIKINIDFLKISVADTGFEISIFERNDEKEPIEIFGKFMENEGKFELTR